MSKPLPGSTLPAPTTDQRNTLNNAIAVDISREKYLELALASPLVQYVELSKPGPNLQAAPVLQKYGAGFDATDLDEKILKQWGAGQYRLACRLVDGTPCAPRLFGLGDPKAPEAQRPS